MTPLASEHAALVASVAQRRDRDAFAVLFDYYSPRLNAYLLRLGADRTSAEDITQEVMVTLWHKADLFDSSKSSLGTWLYRVARNRRIDIARRARVDYVDPAEYALDIPDEQTPAAEGQIDREAAARNALTRHLGVGVEGHDRPLA